MEKLFYPHNVNYCEADINYTVIYQKNGEKLLSSYTLKRFEDQVSDFIRIGRKYLVNPEFIASYDFSESPALIKLKNGMSITVPRRRRSSLLVDLYYVKNK